MRPRPAGRIRLASLPGTRVFDFAGTASKLRQMVEAHGLDRLHRQGFALQNFRLRDDVIFQIPEIPALTPNR